MQTTIIIAVGIIIKYPDYTDLHSLMSSDPLDELTARLRREACYGRDCEPSQAVMPDITLWAAAAYQETSDRN